MWLTGDRSVRTSPGEYFALEFGAQVQLTIKGLFSLQWPFVGASPSRTSPVRKLSGISGLLGKCHLMSPKPPSLLSRHKISNQPTSTLDTRTPLNSPLCTGLSTGALAEDRAVHGAAVSPGQGCPRLHTALFM